MGLGWVWLSVQRWPVTQSCSTGSQMPNASGRGPSLGPSRRASPAGAASSPQPTKPIASTKSPMATAFTIRIEASAQRKRARDLDEPRALSFKRIVLVRAEAQAHHRGRREGRTRAGRAHMCAVAEVAAAEHVGPDPEALRRRRALANLRAVHPGGQGAGRQAGPVGVGPREVVIGALLHGAAGRSRV